MSLIEIVAVMAANFAFVAAAVSLLLAHIRADRELTERLNRRLELAPIIASLRDDLRAANRATFDDQTLALEISEGETIRYLREGAAWQRTIGSGSNEGSNDPANERAGAFRLPPRTKLAMTPPQAEAGELVRVELYLPRAVEFAQREPAPPVELVVRVGSDRRLLVP